MSELCRIGLVGQPNVGKSSLYNRLLGRRLAVVADEAGTTRDRLESPIEFGEHPCILFDLAGIEPKLATGELHKAVQEQVLASLEQADILIWVVDGPQGSTPADQPLAELLRRLNRPVIMAVNKCDAPVHDLFQYEFAQFGIVPMVTISALHDRGVQELRQVVTTFVKPWYAAHSQGAAANPERELRLALVGRPNVGKSTLLNQLAGSTRSVVSSVAGTTRDAVDTIIPAPSIFGKTFTQWQEVRVIDTAGMRRRGKIGHEVEAWSVVRTFDAIDSAEVVLLVLDATEGLVHQDLQVTQQIVKAGRALVIIINKWDLVLEKRRAETGSEQEQKLQEQLLDQLRQQLPFLHWAQVLFLSAMNGQNVPMLGRTVLQAFQSWDIKISQPELDELSQYLCHNPRLKNLQKITLEHNRPPVFHIQIEGRDLPHFSTTRYIENALRERFAIGSTPIKIWSVPSLGKRRDG